MANLEDMIWERVSEDLYCSKEQYVEKLKDWTLEAVNQDGVLVAVVMRKEAEFHFVTFGTAPRLSRATVRNALSPQLGEYGFVLTKTPKPEVRQHRFNKTLGFVEVGEDEYNIHYRLDRGRSAVTRSASCLQ